MTTKQQAFAAMIEAGRALIALDPEIGGIEVRAYKSDDDESRYWGFCIHSEEQQWELDQAAERARRKAEEHEALRRARGEPKPVLDFGDDYGDIPF